MQLRQFAFLTAVVAMSAATPLMGCSDGTSTNNTTSSSSSSGAGGEGGTGNGGNGGASSGGAGGGSSALDLDMTEADFACILKWDKVRLFRITNLLGMQAEALAAANAPGTMDYPVGTVIQLIPNEAMVKRRAGFSAVSKDWEFFFLDTSASGTKIVSRGVDNVVNQFGGNCLNCHQKAMPQYDFVCEKMHGCDPLPITDDIILMTQNGDPRCMP
jgi:hypothetical protein